jgi:transcriptional regulator with XRE-family HTH domain
MSSPQPEATRPKKRERVVCCPRFGERLRQLRGDESRQDVCDAIKAHHNLFIDRSTLLQYERGTVKAPDPVILWALAQHYGVEDVGDLIVVLVKERLARPVGYEIISQSKFTRDQRKVATWLAEFGDESKSAVMILLQKLRAAEQPPPAAEPVRRRTRT